MLLTATTMTVTSKVCSVWFENHNRAGDGVALHLGRLLPVDRQPRNYNDGQVALRLPVGHVGVSNGERELILAGSRGHTGDHSLVWVQFKSRWKIALDASPGVWARSRLAQLCGKLKFSPATNVCGDCDDNLERYRVGLRGGCRRDAGRRQKKKQTPPPFNGKRTVRTL